MKELNLIIENLKAILEECTASEDAVSYVNGEDAGTLKAAIEALEKQERDRWIPVSEALPKEKAEYNVTIKGEYGLPPYVDACYWNDNDNVFEDWNGYYEDYIPVSNVIAWRPLPEPYKEDEA